MSRQHYKKLIGNYLDANNLPYAILLNGAWGCGKTWYLTNQFERDFQERKIIYTSVNGATSIDDISQQIVASKIGGSTGIELGRKGKIVADVLKRFGSKFIEKWTGFDLEDGNTITQLITIDVDEILVVDDIERIKPPLTIGELLGYLNSNFTEASHTKVIVVADEKELLNTLGDQKEEYLRTKEKTIWQTVSYETEFNECFDDLADLFEKQTKDLLLRHKEFLIRRFRLFNIQNLRWILYFFNAIQSLKDNLEYDDNNIELVLSSALILTIEYKSGKINVELREEIPPYIKTTIPTIRLTDGEIFEYDGSGFQSTGHKSTSKEEILPSDVELFSERYLDSEEKRYHFFESLYNLVCFGTLNADQFQEEIDSYTNSVNNSQPWHQIIDQLMNLTMLEDAEFHQCWQEMIIHLEHSRYKLNDLRNIAGLYETHTKVGIQFPTKKKNLYSMLRKEVMNSTDNERDNVYSNVREEVQANSKEYKQLGELADKREKEIINRWQAENISAIINSHKRGNDLTTANLINLISFSQEDNIDNLMSHVFLSVNNCRQFELLLASSLPLLRNNEYRQNRMSNLKRICKMSMKLSKSGTILRFYANRIEKKIEEKVFKEWDRSRKHL